jgi:CelD/BcsL family acetyltransferase involved in cellulose biosynthesis
MLQNTSEPSLQGRLVKGLAAMKALQDQWNTLWTQSNGISVQCYAYCLSSYENIHKQQRRCTVQIATVFEDGELVAVWPLFASYKGAWKVVRPLGPATAEFTEPLIKPGPGSEQRAAKLWQVVKRRSRADLINLPFVRQPTPLGVVLRGERKVVGSEPDVFHHLVWPRANCTWDEYYGTLGSNHRKKLGQRMRSFEKQGKITYEIVTDPDQMEPHIHWLLENKREWAKHVGLKRPGYWLTSDAYIHFLMDWARDDKRPETLRVDLLRLDGEIVAAFVVCVGNTWLEWIIGGYDGEYRKYSPGMILQYNFVKWGHANGLEPDFGIGVEDNKEFWCANQSGPSTTYHIANTLWGRFAYKLLYGTFHKWKARDQKVGEVKQLAAA